MSTHHPPQLDPAICEPARLSRDARFDGRFFIGVKTTGIFCRPICPVRLPKAENVEFLASAAQAIEHGYRPCLRCRPELAPDHPHWPMQPPLVQAALQAINSLGLSDLRVAELAATLGISSRHLRRLLQDALGTTPKALIQTRRVLFAKQLITDSALPIQQIAHAAGFASSRRFNAVFRQYYGRAPGELRRSREPLGAGFSMQLSYRPPYNWQQVRDFLAARAIDQVEWVDSDSYRRNFNFDGQTGQLKLTHTPATHGFLLEVSHPEVRALYSTAQACRRLLDLDALPQEIEQHLQRSPRLAEIMRRQPGLRLPMAWDRFELCVRAVVGQQISVPAARTILGRIARRCAPDGNAPMLFPSPQQLLTASLDNLALTGRRITTLRSLAAAVLDGSLPLHGTDFAAIDQALSKIPGIGPWTRGYIAMRGLGDPDAWPQGDVILHKALGDGGKRLSTAAVEQHSQHWRPWRAYAAIILWHGYSTGT